MIATERMYNMKPVNDPNLKISVSKCMYKMKNIHENIESINLVGSEKADISSQNNLLLPELGAVEERQKILLNQLEDLKGKFQKLRKELNVCAKPIQQTKTVEIPPVDITKFERLTLTVNVNKLPYFLLAVQKLYQNVINLEIKCYKHSTVPKLSEEVAKLQEKLQNGNIENSELPKIQLALFWHNKVENMSLSHSPSRPAIIYESGILRFFSRLTPYLLNYEESNTLTTINNIDNILNICDFMSQDEELSTKTDAKANLKKLNGQLGKFDWIAQTSNFTIADIALYNLIKQLNFEKELTFALSKWFMKLKVQFD